MSTTQLKSTSTSQFKSTKRTSTTRANRDSHHDWDVKNNKSIISREDIYDDINNTCMDKFCRLFSKFPMLSPFGPFRASWDVLVMFMLIYTSLEVPFTLGFGIELQLTGKYYQFGIIALFIDICLLTDIVLNFRTAFFDKYDDLRLITNPKRIAFRYLRGWFLLDLVTSFPFEFILPNNSDEEKGSNFSTYVKVLRIFRLFRIFKILRLLKMVKLFDGFVSNIIAREILMVIRLFKVLCFALLSAHMCACLWYYTGCNSHPKYDTSWIESKGIISFDCGISSDDMDDHTLYIRYSTSWYWAVVTLFTTGYGDIVATNPSEQWIASFVIFMGTCLFGYFVGTITSLIVEGDKVSSTIVNKLEDAQHFCQQKQLPREMSRAVLTHTRYHCTHNYVLGDESDVLNCLPDYLAMDVSLYISRKYLENLDFLGNKFIDPYIRGLIALKMKSISCNKGYKLFVKGDIAEKIYIQRIGKSNHYIYDQKHKKKIKKQIARGDIVGEYSLVQKKRESTLVCQTWCEYYVIDVDDIKEILEKHYGHIWTKKYKTIQNFIKKEYLKPIRRRKKRHCLFSNSPLLPSFVNKEEENDENGENDSEEEDNNEFEEEEEGQLGHCDWGNEKEIEEIKNLKNLKKITDRVLNANKNVLNNNNINFGLNELSRNAYKITKLTTDKNKDVIKKTIMNPLHATSNFTQHATKSMLRGLTRQNSFLRDLEVTKEYKYNNNDQSSSSSDSLLDDIKYNNDIQKKNNQNENENENENENKEKRDTIKVADEIIEMMQLQNELHEEKKSDNDNDNDNYNDNDDNKLEENNNIYSDIDIYNDENDYDENDSQNDSQNDINNTNSTTSNKNKKSNNITRKKRKKNHKTHH